MVAIRVIIGQEGRDQAVQGEEAKSQTATFMLRLKI